jgi:hypothetical protein
MSQCTGTLLNLYQNFYRLLILLHTLFSAAFIADHQILLYFHAYYSTLLSGIPQILLVLNPTNVIDFSLPIRAANC